MPKNLARISLTLSFSLFFGCQLQLAHAKGKETPAAKTAENACIKVYGDCVQHTCREGKVWGERGSGGFSACESMCGNSLNNCLNKIKTISVNPASQKQKAKQKPAAAESTTKPKNRNATGQGAPKNRRR